MKWYKPDDSEIIFEFTECKIEDVQGIIENYLELRNTFLLTIKNNESYRSIGVTKDEVLLKALDESDLIQLGWEKSSLYSDSYELDCWFICIQENGVYLRENGTSWKEIMVKNKQQLKLLMQFLGISQNL